jgi:hypothetical protein
MTMTVQTIPQGDVLHVAAGGPFSLSEAKRTFLDVLHVVEELRLGKILFDGRQVTGIPAIIERFYYGEFIADEVARLLDRGWDRDTPQFAYILHEPVLDPLRLGETVAVNRGVNAKAFDNREEALVWLGWQHDGS